MIYKVCCFSTREIYLDGTKCCERKFVTADPSKANQTFEKWLDDACWDLSGVIMAAETETDTQRLVEISNDDNGYDINIYLSIQQIDLTLLDSLVSATEPFNWTSCRLSGN